MALSYPFSTWGRTSEHAGSVEGRSVSGFERIKAAASGEVARGWWPVPLAALVLMMVAIGLQPALPAEEQAAISPAETLIGSVVLAFVFMSCFLGSMVTAQGRRVGLTLSLPATLLMLLLVVTCPVSGHHGWAPWVAGSFAAAFAATAIHAGAVIASRRRDA